MGDYGLHLSFLSSVNVMFNYTQSETHYVIVVTLYPRSWKA